jgi:hypothetical protein
VSTDMIFALTFKVYATVYARRFLTDLRETKEHGCLMKLPHNNSGFRYLEAEELTPHLYAMIAAASLPLKSIEPDFTVNSSGFSTGHFFRWLDV